MIVAKWSLALFRADAQKCAEEIIGIGETATPAQVVERARDEQSELHKCFTWDDAEAAEKYRLAEARKVLQLLVIDKREADPDSAPVRAFYKIGKVADDGYKQTINILRDDNEYNALLKQAKAELDAFRKKYRNLVELERVFEAIDEIA